MEGPNIFAPKVHRDNSPGQRPGKKEKGKGSLKGFAIILQDGIPKRQLDPAPGVRSVLNLPLPHSNSPSSELSSHRFEAQ